MSISYSKGSASTLETPIITIPPNARSMVMLSNDETLSFSKQQLKRATRNMLELNTTKKIPSGISIGEAANVRKEIVPKMHLKSKVHRRSLGTELKNCSLKVSLINKADDTMLNADRKKANSKIVTSLLVKRSFVKIQSRANSIVATLMIISTFFKDMSDVLFSF